MLRICALSKLIDRLDFHGQAKARVRARVVAVALLASYQYTIGFSAIAGLVVVITYCR